MGLIAALVPIYYVKILTSPWIGTVVNDYIYNNVQWQ